MNPNPIAQSTQWKYGIQYGVQLTSQDVKRNIIYSGTLTVFRVLELFTASKEHRSPDLFSYVMRNIYYFFLNKSLSDCLTSSDMQLIKNLTKNERYWRTKLRALQQSFQ